MNKNCNIFDQQVSDQESDSRYTGVPEKMNYLRKSYKISENRPGKFLYNFPFRVN